jgi:hypothetical protein
MVPMRHPHNIVTPESAGDDFTEEEYLAAERLTDRLVGLLLLTIAVSAALGALLGAATGLGLVGVLLVMGAACGGLMWWAAPKLRSLPAQRQAVRPIHIGWVLRALGAFVLVGVVALWIVGYLAAH